MSKDKKQIIEYKDAVSEALRIIAPQIGVDFEGLQEGKIDPRRLSRINKIESFWMSWFLHLPDNEGGEFMREFIEDMLNLNMSLEGHERSKLLVEALRAVTTSQKTQDKAKDNRNWIERNITKRGLEPVE